ncbi:MAG TPA: hypothetical protein DCG75_10445 [Bacteroidales bacterium]|jgi:hypothetical protein|nr:hypothetical protein [Bacteroidales bacterium]
MNNFVKRVIEGNGITPPIICLNAFNSNFNDTINVEWFDRADHFEAIFYKDNLEHIAIFDLSGSLVEYKLFLPVEFLPEAIKTYLESKGEIMNSVLINKGNTIEYEVIVRDANFTRYLILLSDLGKVIEEKKL